MAEAPDSLEPFGAVQRTQTGREATEPMRDDIRMLGAILGDTVREQNGDEVFDWWSGPASRRSGCVARRSSAPRWQDFRRHRIRQAIPVIRAFSHFALLANVAEDIHHERRRAIHVDAGDPPQDSTLAATYQKLDSADLDAATVAEALTGALVSPVITAHPTETRRDGLRHPAPHHQLMRLHAQGHTKTDDGDDIEPSCGARCSRCGRPRWSGCPGCRSPTKSRSACAITRQRFSTWCRGSTPKSARRCAAAGPTRDVLAEPILRPGSWIGGDRDGNPNVTADVVRLATGSAAYTALDHYTAQLSALEQELSMSTRLVAVTDELTCWPRTATSRPAPTSPTVARCASSTAGSPLRRQILDEEPDNLLDLGSAAILDAGGAARRPRHRRRLAARPRRARSPTTGWLGCASGRRLRVPPLRAGPAAELRRARGGRRRTARLGGRAADYLAELDERVSVLAGELGIRRPLVGDASCPIWRATNSRSSRRGPGVATTVRPRCPTTSSPCAFGLRPARGRRPAQGGRAADAAAESRLLGRHRAAVRDDRRPAPRRADMTGARPSALPAHRATPAATPGGHARLLRQQQGRRLPHRELGAVPGRAGSRRAARKPVSGCGCSTAAAARSAAAAARATRRSWRSRPAR